jgi:hypothetical protein
MAKFFNYYPKTFYISNNNVTGAESITNIITRFSFEKELKDNTLVFYEYNIKESDTPESIAHKLYGDSERHWIVLLFNDIIDPQWDWPLQTDALNEYVNQKYSARGAANTTPQSGLIWALSENNVESYFKVITTTGSEGTQRIEKISLDANTYANVITSTTSYVTSNNESVSVKISKETRSFYNYELEENEKKRTIKLLKKEFVSEVEKEFKRVVSI